MLSDIYNWFANFDLMSTILYTSALLLYAAGFLGAVLPYPGCFVALGGSVCYALANGSPSSWWVWLILTLLATFGTLAD
ncbi:MAG: hypothetical protein J6C91_00845, partial [Muribaculaceae bacterium]|nr:hypothetical protein [Muribaculaceae bacterium]